MSENLAFRHCVPCEGGVDPMTRKDFEVYLEQVAAWRISDNDTKLERDFTFKDFARAVKFINALAAVAEEEGHHPDIFLHGWNKVRITLTTHSAGGITMNDVTLAREIDTITL